MELKPLKLQAEVMWAFLDTPNELSGKYQVDLCNLTKGAIETLQEMGVNVRTKPDQPEKGHFITAKSTTKPIAAVDTEGNKITAKVANGSKCVAIVNPFEYTFKGKKGVSVGANKLIITELKVYEPDTEVLDDVL